jgi:cellulose biosynthesis protein BcsQ
MNKMASENNLDFIIIDCGPASGVLNKIMCMSCHFILPSAEPDFQNVCSLDGMLKYVLPRSVKKR